MWKSRPPFVMKPYTLDMGEKTTIIPELMFRLPFGYILSPSDGYTMFKLYRGEKYLQYVVCFRGIKSYDFYRNHTLDLIWNDRAGIKVYIDARDMKISPKVSRWLLRKAFQIMGFGLIVFEN